MNKMGTIMMYTFKIMRFWIKFLTYVVTKTRARNGLYSPLWISNQQIYRLESGLV